MELEEWAVTADGKSLYVIFICVFVSIVMAGCGSGSKSSGTQPSNTTDPASSTGSASATLVPSGLTFSSQEINSSTSPQSVTLTNTGSLALSLSQLSVTGAFSQTNNCGNSLASGAACTIQVTFTPTAVGTQSGTLTVSDNASSGSQQVALSGTGVSAVVSAATPAATVSPASYSFSDEVLGSTSPVGTVGLQNTGSAALSITSLSIAGDFAQTNNCGSSLAAGASCTVNVTFTPTALGNRTGTLTFGDNASPATQTVSLYGVGVQAGSLTVSPGQISFGNVVVGTTSSQAATITNSGGTSVTVSSISSSTTGFSVSGISLPFVLGPNASTSFSIGFDPTNTGSVSGTVILANNSPTTSVAIAVGGTGEAAPSHSVALQWSESTTANVVGYYAYRGTVSGGPYTKLNSSATTTTSYTDQSVQAGDTYYYVVTALGSDGVESAYSSQATATIPTP